MKYAICNETFQDWPFEKAFAYAKEIGYTGVEIAPFTINDDARLISAEKRAEVKGQIIDSGLECVGLHWLLAKTEGFYLTTTNAKVRQETADYLKELARLCRDLDGKIMVFGFSFSAQLVTRGESRAGDGVCCGGGARCDAGSGGLRSDFGT